MTERRYWTTTEVRELSRLYPGMENAAIGKIIGRSRSAVQQMAGKLGLAKSAEFLAGPHCRWQSGNRSWNTGMKGWQAGGRARLTQFKKGHRDGRYKPVGFERRERDGWSVKVAEPDVWVTKPRYVWERHFGQIPAGAVVRLKDGNPDNCAPDNLRLVTRAEHLRLNWKPRGPVRKAITWTAPLRVVS